MLKVSLRIRGFAEITLPVVWPGKSASLEDWSSGHCEILVFTCSPDDSGGVVQRSLQGGHVEYDDIREVHSRQLRLEERLGPGDSTVVPVVRRNGQRAKLTVWHVAEPPDRAA